MRKKILFLNMVIMASMMSCGLLVQAEHESEAGQTEAASEMAADPEKSAKDGLFGEFETITLEGEAVDQDIFTESELNMVNIWGTFCGPCIREMPDLGELSEEYEEKGLRIIGIISDVMTAEHEAARKIVDETGADYTHLLLSEDLLDSYLWEVQVVPTTVFLDSEGKQVGEVYTGSRTKEEWSEIVDELLGQIEEDAS